MITSYLDTSSNTHKIDVIREMLYIMSPTSCQEQNSDRFGPNVKKDEHGILVIIIILSILITYIFYVFIESLRCWYHSTSPNDFKNKMASFLFLCSDPNYKIGYLDKQTYNKLEGIGEPGSVSLYGPQDSVEQI